MVRPEQNIFFRMGAPSSGSLQVQLLEMPFMNKQGGNTMQYSYLRCLLAVVVVAGVSGCDAISGLGRGQEMSAQQVPLAEIPAPVRITLERLIAGGQIRVLTQREIDGQVIYHVEASVDGKDVAYDVAGDGTVLALREGISYASLPGAVLASVQEFSDLVPGLEVCNEVQGGKKNHVVATLKLTHTGRIIAKETS